MWQTTPRLPLRRPTAVAGRAGNFLQRPHSRDATLHAILAVHPLQFWLCNIGPLLSLATDFISFRSTIHMSAMADLPRVPASAAAELDPVDLYCVGAMLSDEEQLVQQS